MKKLIIFAFVLFLISCSPTTYYVVRHAEKESSSTMSSDVPLSSAGEQRAIALKDALIKKNIRYIFSTNYQRTKATAQPLSSRLNIPVQMYNPADTSFITKIKNLDKGNVLIVGHSNTIDDVINQFLGEKHLQDLPESAYGDLFIIKKKGSNYILEKSRFGK